ncbi:MAG: CZB domain-containing protein [Gammaproteobacteria bacterium]|nr:CZB domain-containing protein [Gammaproteobacteria bacterium]
MEISSAVDITTVIGAHNAWKRNVISVIEGTATQDFDANTVKQDNVCILGKWIYGDSSNQYSDTEEFQELKTLHTQFHSIAGTAIQLAQSGQASEARAMVETGEYPTLSRNITMLLTTLYRQTK